MGSFNQSVAIKRLSYCKIILPLIHINCRSFSKNCIKSARHVAHHAAAGDLPPSTTPSSPPAAHRVQFVVEIRNRSYLIIIRTETGSGLAPNPHDNQEITVCE